MGSCKHSILVFLGFIFLLAPSGHAAFQKVGPLVYHLGVSGGSSATGSAVIILVPPGPDTSIPSGIFAAAGKKPFSIQEFTAPEKLISGPEGFETAFLVFNREAGTFKSLQIRDRSFDLTPDFVFNVGPLRIAKSSTSQSGPYTSFTMFNRVLSFLGFQLVANEEGSERVPLLLEAYQPPFGVRPYVVVDGALRLDDAEVAEMRFPMDDPEQNQCARQGASWVHMPASSEGESAGALPESVKAEDPSNYIHLRVGKQFILALGMNGSPVVIQEDTRFSYSGTLCAVSVPKFR